MLNIALLPERNFHFQHLKTKAKASYKYFPFYGLGYLETFGLFEHSQASPACPSESNCMNMYISMEHWWTDDSSQENRRTPTGNYPGAIFVHHKYIMERPGCEADE